MKIEFQVMRINNRNNIPASVFKQFGNIFINFKNYTMKDFKNLKIWQHGINLVVDVYQASKNFPPEELYGLTSQVRRSAVSIPSNIAEGSGRDSDKDFCRFLDISLGSSFELETQIIIAHKLDFLSEEVYVDLTEKIREEQKMISGLHKKIK
jgi:four helix bundle protein